ncbi:hypothetical protein F5Y16DRAFT_389820 [Xylariaceae sp. FL0255]|nr:hypothetical protein F5Y16DRAFT_389820 [Xylariaceae sp. FL0255]
MSSPHPEPDSQSSSSTDLERQHTSPGDSESPLRPNHPRHYTDGSVSSEEVDRRERVLPRFMEEEGTGKRWRWVPYPIRKGTRFVVNWIEGPENPRIFKIKPFLPAIQEAPIRFLDRVLPSRKHRIWLFFAYMSAWILTFALVDWHSQVAADIEGYGEPSEIGCGTTYWSKDNGCGIDGDDCRPFDNSSFAFRCPSSCTSYHVLNPRAVGITEVDYATFVIGGPSDPSNDLNPIYRGDSFICQAAIHAGLVSDTTDGCGVVSLVGEQSNFTSSDRNGIDSIAFDSYFPLSFTFLSGIDCHAQDASFSLLAISVVFTGILSLFTTSSAAFFFGTFIIAFWQVGLASDPPLTGPVNSLFSNVLGNFLPAMFVGWVIYDKMGVRRTLRGLTAQVEKTVLWLGALWVGALTNYTFDYIPIQRLTGHDLDQQPGAKAALAIIVAVLVVIVGGQIWCFQQERRLVRYLQLYALFLFAIIIGLVLPGLSLRIHHYILALLLLPGTSIQTRPSLLYQGLLVGFFVNGIARWGFDSVLQTAAALQGDAQTGSALPELLAPIINTTLKTITFQWQQPADDIYDGVSILVNDVERYRGFFDDQDGFEFTWTRDMNGTYNEYFRFAFIEGATAEDYTKAGTWNAGMEWVQMAAGASRIKGRDLDAPGYSDVLLPRDLRRHDWNRK